MKAKKVLKYSLEGIVFIFLFFCLLNYDLLLYGIGQAKGQINIIWNARPVEEVLKDPDFPDSLKTKLKLVNDIREFTFSQLGINRNSNYTTIFDQKGKPVLWVVTASKPFELEDHEWWFPVLGNVSYKGFFDLKKAQLEEVRLKQLGFDTDIGRVGGWSTLGYFTDPVLSNMLENTDGSLANLLIHELTHGTLYVKNNVKFNENLASFIGDKGAILFLKQRYGNESNELKDYMNSKKDEDQVNKYILKGAEALDSLFKNPRFKALNETQKLIEKDAIITKIANGLIELPLYNSKRYLRLAARMKKSKNAIFMTFIRYDSKQSTFESEFNEKFNGDIKSYLTYLKSIYPSV